MDKQVKRILCSKTFWTMLILGVLFWGFRRYTFWDVDIMFLVLSGPYILPLIIPAVFFFLFVQKRKKSYFKTTVTLLILWSIWSLFWLEIWSQGWGTSIDVSSFVLFICPILLTSIISIVYVYYCKNILNKGKNALFQCKKKILWISWFIGLAIIIIGGWLCTYTASDIGTRLRGDSPWSSMDYIVRLIDFFLMWLIFTLPATLKIDNIFSKES